MNNLKYTPHCNFLKTLGVHFFVLVFALIVFLTACSNPASDPPPDPSDPSGRPIITMTTAEVGTVLILLTGSNEATISWGDGSALLTKTLSNSNVRYQHTYTAHGNKTISISSKGSITGLHCSGTKLVSLDVSKNTALMQLNCVNTQLTSLDISKNTALKFLGCGNTPLTNIDISKNTALTQLWCEDSNLTSLDATKNTMLYDLNCRNNNMDADALNTLFETLPSNWPASIRYGGNPGVGNCSSIPAMLKGWTVSH